MVQTLAYIRVSEDKQDMKNQRHEILEAARLRDIKIDDFISRKRYQADSSITQQGSEISRSMILFLSP